MYRGLFRHPCESNDESSLSEEPSLTSSASQVSGISPPSLTPALRDGLDSSAASTPNPNNQPMVVYSPELPQPSLLPNYQHNILFTALLETIIRSQINHPALADHALVEMSRRLSELGIAPPNSENFARPELSSMRGSALGGLETLLQQVLLQQRIGAADIGPRPVDGGQSMVLRENQRPAAPPNPPMLRRMMTEGPRASLDSDGRPVLQRSNSLTILPNAAKPSRYRPSTAPALAESPPSFFPIESHSEQALSDVNIIVTPSRYTSDFTELGFLGRGGFGSVYHVRNRLDGAEYAIKKISLKEEVFKGNHEHGTGPFERVMREVNTMARVEHPNIVRYYASWIDGIIAEQFSAGLAGGTPAASNANLYATTKHGGTNISKKHPVSKIEPSHDSNQATDAGDGLIFGYDTDSRVETLDSAGLSKPLSKGTGGGDSSDCTDSGSEGLSRESVEDISRSYPLDSQYVNQSQSNWTSSHNDSIVQTTTGGSDDNSESYLSESALFSAGNGTMVKSSTRNLGRADRGSKSGTGITLHIQMSIHKLGLTSYLSPSKNSDNQHCFCVIASMRLFYGLVDGVLYLHRQKIAHRDLKPGNIFLDVYEDGKCCKCPHAPKCLIVPRIGDFGLVKNIAEPTGAASPGTAVGTEFYRPPAGIMDHDMVGRDMFALGVILVELVHRFDTRMERMSVLSGLTKEGKIPACLDARIADIVRGCCRLGPYVKKRWDLERVKQAIMQLEIAEGQK